MVHVAIQMDVEMTAAYGLFFFYFSVVTEMVSAVAVTASNTRRKRI